MRQQPSSRGHHRRPFCPCGRQCRPPILGQAQPVVCAVSLGLTSLLHGSAVFDPESPRPWAADPRRARAVPVVTGALMLVRRELWDNLGGFDPTFFMYGEDADFASGLPRKASVHGDRQGALRA